MTARGPDLNPILDRRVTCPACQQRTPAPDPTCELCGGTMLVRQGLRDRWTVEQQLQTRIMGEGSIGPGRDPYDVP